MTDKSKTSEEIFKEACDAITRQNLALMKRIQEPNFDPGMELDNTRNDAIYKIADFFCACGLFPHGNLPTQLSDRMVETTDELIKAIRMRYGGMGQVTELAIRVGHAFRGSKRIWRIRKAAPELSPKAFKAELTGCQAQIMSALDDLNAELDRVTCGELPVVAACRDAVPAEAVTPAQLKHATKELKRHISVATSGSYEGCHHRNKAKDALVQQVIRYLAKPGVVFSINNACVKIAGSDRPGHCREHWLYAWCHNHAKEIEVAVSACGL